MKRLALILMSLLMLVSLAVPAMAADEGMTFSSDKLYKSDKFLEAKPNTFEFVVRLPKGHTARPGVIYSNYEKTSDNAVCIQIQANATIQLYYQKQDRKPVKYIFENAPINTGEWVHVAVVRDEAAGNVSCYINGEFFQTSTVAMEEYGYLTSSETLKGMCIGGDYRPDNTYYFKCELKEIALYSDVRTAEEIKADFAGIKETNDNLLAWFQPKADMTYEIPDLSGNGYTVRTKDAPVTTKPADTTAAPAATKPADTTAATTTPQPAGTTTAPATFDAGIITAVVAAVSLAGTVVLKKKK